MWEYFWKFQQGKFMQNTIKNKAIRTTKLCKIMTRSLETCVQVISWIMKAIMANGKKIAYFSEKKSQAWNYKMVNLASYLKKITQVTHQEINFQLLRRFRRYKRITNMLLVFWKTHLDQSHFFLRCSDRDSWWESTKVFRSADYDMHLVRKTKMV